MEITFYGAAKMVTGSKHLLQLNDGYKILLDCGMFQGAGKESDALNRHFGFDPHEVDCLVLSHAHIDHSGLIPRLVKEGFNGPIYCTPATYDLCTIMLADSAFIQESDIAFINRKRAQRDKSPLKPLYTIADVQPALALFQQVNYNTAFSIRPDVELTFTDAGHILGSASVHLKIAEEEKEKRLTFTGDIGRYGSRIIRDPQPFPQADYIICESTYGDRLHESPQEAERLLLQAVEETCVIKGGKLIIPAFSVGRTQEVVNVLNNLEHEGKLPPLKVFVDSPLSTNATEIMRNHKECFNEDIIEYMKSDPTPFGFDNLHYIQDAEESKALNSLKGPAIIISASGMAEAGRIKHHLRNNITDPRNTVLIIGWCSPGSLGSELVHGAGQVSIFGETFDVNADVVVLNPFSAHGDYNEMIRFLSCQDPQKVKQVFLVHGEEEVIHQWRIRLKSEGFEKIEIPSLKESYVLNDIQAGG